MNRRKVPVQRKKKPVSKQPRFDIPKTSTAIYNFFGSTLNWVQTLIESEPEYSAGSMTRDEWLSDIWKAEPYLAGVLNSVVSIDTNRGWSLEGGRNQVMRYNDIFHNWEVAPGFKGWRPGISNASLSYYYTDIGGVVELGRDGESGPLRGLYHVDSTRCYLNGNNETPLTYSPSIVTPENNKEQDWKSTDFMRVASMISTREEYNGLGFCAISRCIELAKIMVAVYEHDREQLGAKAPKGLLMLNGINEQQWQDAMDARKGKLAAEQYDYFNAVAVLASMGGEPISAQLVGLSTLPEGFNLQQFTSMLMYGYALCFNYDPREFWPVSGGQLGTSMETEIQQEKATGKGGLNFIYALQEQLQRGDVLPAALKFEFEQRDEESEIQEALAEKAWIDNYNAVRNSGNGQPGEEGITRDEYRMLLADHNIIPKEWTEVEEDIEVTDEEMEDDEEALPEQPQPADAIPLLPVPKPLPIPQMRARQKRILRDRLLSQRHILRAIELFPSQDIIRFRWPDNTIETVWRRADTLLERYYFQGVTREGNEASGNYEHEGRPGEVGGSTPNPSTVIKEGKGKWKSVSEGNKSKLEGCCTSGDAKFIQKMTYDETNQGVNGYFRNGSGNINDAWRFKNLFDESSIETTEDMTLYRGMNLSQETLNKMIESGGFTDKGFPSTTTIDAIAAAFTEIRGGDFHVLFRMSVRAGTRVMAIGRNNIGEILLDQGAHFRITGYPSNYRVEGECDSAMLPYIPAGQEYLLMDVEVEYGE